MDEAEEFAYAGPANEDETALAYVWLLTGRSHVPEVPITKGVIHRTEWISESGESSYRSLGDVRLWSNKLELLCLSKNTILFHRYNIRQKLDLKNKKINLRTHLLSYDR